MRQRQGRPHPQRKQRGDAGAVELLLAVGLDIRKEQIAEDDVGNALATAPATASPIRAS